MEPAFRSPWIKSTITWLETTRFWPLRPPKFPAADRHWPSKPCRGERNFWMQRREAKIGLRDRKRHRRPKERDLAVMIGVGRQTINRLLKSLEQDGIVTTSYTALTIQNVWPRISPRPDVPARGVHPPAPPSVL